MGMRNRGHLNKLGPMEVAAPETCLRQGYGKAGGRTPIALALRV